MKTGDYGSILGILCGVLLFLSGCDHKKAHKYHDPELEYQKKDYEMLTAFPKRPPLNKRKKISVAVSKT